VAALLLGCAAPGWAQGDPGGVYLRTGEPPARLEVIRDGELFRVTLEAGASPSAGAVAADCIVEGSGRLIDQVIEVPLPTMSPLQSGSLLRIRFGDGAAEVFEAETFGYCGLGAALSGHYRRR
jgi:hypothetical protein